MKNTRTLKLNRKVFGGVMPRPMTARSLKPSDFPHIRPAHLEIAKKLSSPLMLGPPLCEELTEFVCHVFSEEEAELVQHLSGMKWRVLDEVALAAHRPKEEAAEILRNLAHYKAVIISRGPRARKQYRLIPVIPGMFEMCLVAESPDTLSEWHKKFIDLIERLYETGYIRAYGDTMPRVVRFLPSTETVSGNPLALPSDKLEVVFDRYDTFAVGNCQCRMTMGVLGKSCGKPLGNCIVMGDWAASAIRKGRMKEITKKDALERKAEAEYHGLTSWIMNVESSKGQVSCSCCGCCCHALRLVSEFNSPGWIAPPHFVPVFDTDACNYCGKCARGCPMGAIVVDAVQKNAWRLEARCVGCGMCAGICSDKKAIRMEPVPDYKLPPGSWYAMIAREGYRAFRSALEAWLRR